MLIWGAYNVLQWLHKGAESNRKREAAAAEKGSASLESWIQTDGNAISRKKFKLGLFPNISVNDKYDKISVHGVFKSPVCGI